MKLSKTMGEALCDLFGPNGQKTTRVSSDSLRFKAFKELERHGLVTLSQPDSEYRCLYEVTRTMDEGKTLCQLASDGKL